MTQSQDTRPNNTDELLRTKLTPPRLHASLVPRAQLMARLEAGLDHKLTLVSAPAGFGKTTLVSQWLHQLHITEESQLNLQSRQVAWVSLDAGDNDPVRFWRYLLTACQAFDPTVVGVSSLPLLQASQQPPWEAFLTALVNELSSLPCRSVLVLDDYHVIARRTIHEWMAFLLDYLPATLHLMLLTRSDPPLPLARLRARNEVSELSAADLRFSPAETAAFLERAIPAPLTPETIARLDERTEGWAAGLRLATLALQGHTDPHKIEQVLAGFTGGHRNIAEYLVGDVLGTQPEQVQTFLLQTCILDQICAPLCDALMGDWRLEIRDWGSQSLISNLQSQQMLDELERANLFITALDDRHGWYRYHTLFAEALRHEARRRLGEASLRALHDRASRWYEQQGALAEAIEAACAAQTWARAAELIERSTAPQLVKNEYHTLRRWLEQLPEATLRAHPSLAFAHAVAILFTSDRRARTTWALLEPSLALAEQGRRAAGKPDELGAVLAFRAMVAWWQGDLSRSLAAARQALELLPEHETQWRGISLLFVGLEQLLAGQLSLAQQTLAKARALSETTGNVYGALSAISLLGEVHAHSGELRQAAQLYRQVLAVVEDPRLDPDQALLERARALNGLAALAYEWNDLAAAEQQAAQAREIGAQLADEELLVPASLTLAHVQQARGETAQAQQRLHALVAQLKQPRLLREVQAAQAALGLAAGDIAAAQRWRAALAQYEHPAPRIQQEREALIAARMQIAQGQAAAARETLDGWRAGARAHGRTRSELEIMVTVALAHTAESNLPSARRTLVEALRLAQPEGYQRLLLDHGEPMRLQIADCRLQIAQQASAGNHELAALLEYVDRLLNAFPSSELGVISYEFDIEQIKTQNYALERSEGSKLMTQNSLVEPLSPQEQRVLRLLAAGLSYPEIARELVVSVNTVKTQIKSIYRKLDVSSRSEAREAARRLNLR